MKNEIIVLGNMYDSTNKFLASGRVYSGGGIAPTIGASHFGCEKYIMEKETVSIKQATKSGYIECEVGGGGRPKFP